MYKCDTCSEDFEKMSEYESHMQTHQLMHVSNDPLSYMLDLGSACDGKFEAAKAFVEAIRQLREKHPGIKFTPLPFSYKTAGGEDPALYQILAVAE